LINWLTLRIVDATNSKQQSKATDMNGFQILAMAIGAVMIFAFGISLKYKQCQYMAPDHVTYCMLMTR
jgi:hypothetical protein